LPRRQLAALNERLLKALTLKGTARPDVLQFQRDGRNALSKTIGGEYE
jgi:hypothetical protein